MSPPTSYKVLVLREALEAALAKNPTTPTGNYVLTTIIGCYIVDGASTDEELEAAVRANREDRRAEASFARSEARAGESVEILGVKKKRRTNTSSWVREFTSACRPGR